MKREVKGLSFIVVFLFSLLLIMNFASASFVLGSPNHSIITVYAPEDNIKGWINLSLSSEPSNSTFLTGDGDSIILSNLIATDVNFQYSCIPTDCSSDYSKSNEAVLKNYVLSGDEKIFGFELIGTTFNSLSSFSLGVVSDAAESSSPQLSIDILNDGVIDWQSYVPSTEGNKDYGCYLAPAAGQADIVASTSYCEKINLSIAPNLTIGAEVIKKAGITAGLVNFTLIIDDKQGIYETCEANATNTGTVSCSPKNGKFRVTEEKTYHVCIKAKSSTDNNNYKINYERTGSCGYVGTDATWDFEIFAQPHKYAGLGSMVLDRTEIKKYNSNSQNIENLINNYVSSKYGNSCDNGCIIPVKISGTSQNILLANALLSYTAGISTSTGIIYDLDEAGAKISTSGYKKLNLDGANFLTPEEFGEYNFSLKLNSKGMFSEAISVERIPRIDSLTPNTVMAAYPATLNVDVETFSKKINITKYKWIFDAETQTTTRNILEHTFPNVGKYNLTIEVTDTKNVTASRTFAIVAEVPTKAIALDLAEKSESILKLNSSLNSLPVFYRNSIRTILNLTSIETQLDEIRDRNATASTTQDYIDIMTDLMTIKVPRNISTSIKAEAVPFYARTDAVNIAVLKDISKVTKSLDEKKYKDAVVAWNFENINTKINFDEISANYNEQDIPLIRFFDVKISREDEGENPYFVVSNLENLKFDKDYSEKKSGDYYYIELKNDETEITFSTTEEVNFQDLPAFITPKTSELSVVSIDITGGEESNRIIIAIVAVLALIALGVLVWFFMQKWYKNKYEDYLFKNKNDLYNLVSYIQTARRNGLGEGEIINRLKKSKWKSEQIKYVMKKSK